MKVEKTKLDGVLLIKLVGFEDHGGEYLELYNETLYKSKGIEIHFVEDNINMRHHRLQLMVCLFLIVATIAAYSL